MAQSSLSLGLFPEKNESKWFWCCLYGGQNDHGASPILPSTDACLKTNEICVFLYFSFFLQGHVRNVFTLTPRRHLKVLSFNFVYLKLCLRLERVVGWVSWGKREDPNCQRKLQKNSTRSRSNHHTDSEGTSFKSHRLRKTGCCLTIYNWPVRSVYSILSRRFYGCDTVVDNAAYCAVTRIFVGQST